VCNLKLEKEWSRRGLAKRGGSNVRLERDVHGGGRAGKAVLSMGKACVSNSSMGNGSLSRNRIVQKFWGGIVCQKKSFVGPKRSYDFDGQGDVQKNGR